MAYDVAASPYLAHLPTCKQVTINVQKQEGLVIPKYCHVPPRDGFPLEAPSLNWFEDSDEDDKSDEGDEEYEEYDKDSDEDTEHIENWGV